MEGDTMSHADDALPFVSEEETRERLDKINKELDEGVKAMTQSEELGIEPCPECKRQPEIIAPDDWSDLWTVICHPCEFSGDDSLTEEEAIHVWNKEVIK
jgi:hypothetical protein